MRRRFYFVLILLLLQGPSVKDTVEYTSKEASVANDLTGQGWSSVAREISGAKREPTLTVEDMREGGFRPLDFQGRLEWGRQPLSAPLRLLYTPWMAMERQQGRGRFRFGIQ